jgi:hypothetical protein
MHPRARYAALLLPLVVACALPRTAPPPPPPVAATPALLEEEIPPLERPKIEITDVTRRTAPTAKR